MLELTRFEMRLEAVKTIVTNKPSKHEAVISPVQVQMMLFVGLNTGYSCGWRQVFRVSIYQNTKL